jgi:MFS family permease
MAVTPAARLAQPRRWPGVVAWALWALAVAACLVIPWLDDRLRRAGRADLTQWDARPGVAAVITVTVGAVLASRRPRHPVGWLLLAQTVVLLAAAAAAQYVAWGLLAPGGAFPATRQVALYYSAATGGGLILLGFVLLLTPTGRLPSPRWRWAARTMVAVPLGVLVVVTLAPGPVDPYQQLLAGPFDVRGLNGVLLVVNQLALVFTTLTVAACAGSLVVRFRRTRGVERQQLRWVALAAALMVPAAVVALAGMALAATDVVIWAITAWLAGLPLAIGAAVLRYRLYDLDRIISRTLAYGLLSVLLGDGYAAVVLGLGQLLGRDSSSLVVAAATPAAAAVFQPTRRRIQQAVDRRFNRRRHDAAQRIAAFSDHLREQVDLDALTAELLVVVDQTMQPTGVSLWLRPSPHDSSGTTRSEALPTTWAY